MEAEGKNDEPKDGAADTEAPTDMLAKCFTKCSFYSQLHDQHIPDKFPVCMFVDELVLGLASPTPAHRQRGVNCRCACTWPVHEIILTRLIVHRLLLNKKALWRRRARTMNQRMVQPTPRPPQTYMVKCFTKCSFYSQLRAMINTFLTSFLCACLSMSWCWAWQAQHQLINNVV